jgi:hypothetical protein
MSTEPARQEQVSPEHRSRRDQALCGAGDLAYRAACAVRAELMASAGRIFTVSSGDAHCRRESARNHWIDFRSSTTHSMRLSELTEGCPSASGWPDLFSCAVAA